MAATPRRNSDSLASACCQSAQATPGPGAASVSTHFYTWTNSKRGQEKQPTHPYLSPCPPFSFPPIQEHSIWGTIGCLLTSSPSSPLFLSSDGCVHIFLVPFTGLLKHYLPCYGCIAWPSYTWFYFHNSLYLWLMCALKKNNKKKKFTFW